MLFDSNEEIKLNQKQNKFIKQLDISYVHVYT